MDNCLSCRLPINLFSELFKIYKVTDTQAQQQILKEVILTFQEEETVDESRFEQAIEMSIVKYHKQVVS